jgi:hypothetical protein
VSWLTVADPEQEVDVRLVRLLVGPEARVSIEPEQRTPDPRISLQPGMYRAAQCREGSFDERSCRRSDAASVLVAVGVEVGARVSAARPSRKPHASVGNPVNLFIASSSLVLDV